MGGSWRRGSELIHSQSAAQSVRMSWTWRGGTKDPPWDGSPTSMERIRKRPGSVSG